MTDYPADDSLDVVQKFVDRWTSVSEDNPKLADIVTDPALKDLEMTLGDLRLVLAVALGAKNRRAEFVRNAELAVVGWKLANKRQQKTISRLLNNVLEIKQYVTKGVRVAHDKSDVIDTIKQILEKE